MYVDTANDARATGNICTILQFLHVTFAEIAAGLAENGRVEVLLPSNFNHALFAHFYPDAPAGVEAFDINGGAEVLQRAAELDGLDDMRALQRWVAERQARVHCLARRASSSAVRNR